MIVGKLIQAYREKHGIPVRDLAKQIGVEWSSLWRFEQGKSVNSKLWVRIVKWILTEDHTNK